MERRTERLLLRGWRDDDLDPLAELDADPRVMRFIGDGSTRTREQTAGTLARLRQHWLDHGYGLFAAEILETGELAGWVGLAVPNFLPELLPAVEIGWRLRPSCWGRGYATEAAREVMAFGFDDYLNRIPTPRHGRASRARWRSTTPPQRIMRSLGSRRRRCRFCVRQPTHLARRSHVMRPSTAPLSRRCYFKQERWRKHARRCDGYWTLPCPSAPPGWGSGCPGSAERPRRSTSVARVI